MRSVNPLLSDDGGLRLSGGPDRPVRLSAHERAEGIVDRQKSWSSKRTAGCCIVR